VTVCASISIFLSVGEWATPLPPLPTQPKNAKFVQIPNPIRTAQKTPMLIPIMSPKLVSESSLVPAALATAVGDDVTTMEDAALNTLLAD